MSKRIDKLGSDVQSLIKEAQKTYPVKPGSICRKLGIGAYLADLPRGISGKIVKDETEKGGYAIYVNKNDNAQRQRFTTAHELAHYLLHDKEIGDGIVDNPLYRSHLSNKMEIEANQLAADILMPYEKIDEEFEKDKKTLTIQELARRFGVSVPAMKVRLGIPYDK